MPRRQPAKEVPRWRRGKSSQPGPHIRLSPKQERQLVERLAASGALQGQVIGQHAPQGKVAGTVARTGAYRFRYQLVPFAWLAGVAITGAAARAPHTTHAAVIGIVLGLAAAATMVLLTRHLPRCPEKGKGHSRCFTRHAWQAMAALTALWVTALSLGAGSWHPLLFAGLVCWVGVLVPWVRHYRIRAEQPGKAAAPALPMGDIDIWTRLAAKNHWQGHLANHESLPDGGRQWHIVLNGAETHIGQVMSEPRKIAAAWGKSITEAYAEPAPDGIESRGRLTILPRNTLEKSRQWDRSPIDHETGMAVVGWFPDGQLAHERYFIRRNGVRHTIVGGADGSGKTGMLDLGLCLSATSGIITPVILDPQEGQALPAWKGRVPYACGVPACVAYLRGLHAAMLDRSRYLAELTWEAPDGTERKGMGFFDPFLTGLPIVEVTLDESPALLADPKWGAEAVMLLGGIGKMGRKVGFRLRLGVQVPSLAELGGSQALRSMLVGGNVFCGRAGDKVTGGMIGISADPSALPKYFPDGKPTVGLGYTSGPDNRPSTPMRWMWVEDPYSVAASAHIRPMDDRCADAMERGMIGMAAPVTLPAASQPPLAAVPPTDDDAPPGRTAADAILAVLDEAGGPLDRGEIVKRSGVLVTTSWGRAKPFSVRAQGDALKALAEAGRIEKTGHGTYCRVRPTLHAVAQTDDAESEATGA